MLHFTFFQDRDLLLCNLVSDHVFKTGFRGRGEYGAVWILAIWNFAYILTAATYIAWDRYHVNWLCPHCVWLLNKAQYLIRGGGKALETRMRETEKGREGKEEKTKKKREGKRGEEKGKGKKEKKERRDMETHIWTKRTRREKFVTSTTHSSKDQW